jgi:glutathione synthase
MKFIFQMDEINDLNHNSDSTIALIKESLSRNIQVFYYTCKNLFYLNGEIFAMIKPIYYKNGACIIRDEILFKLIEADVVFIRNEPPFNMEYITATYLLDRIKNKVFCINNPTSIRNYPEKISSFDYAEYMVPTMVGLDLNILLEFFRNWKKCVIKPLYNFGGKDIAKIENEKDLKTHFKLLQEKYPNIPVLLQKFQEKIVLGDKRVILFDGEILGAINRVPTKGEFKANLALGSKPERTTLTEKELKISKKIAINLKKDGILLAGIDLIDEWLSEINVTCPTGIVTINNIEKYIGKNRLEAKIINSIMSKIK